MSTQEYIEFGERLKKLREQLNLSQAELAKKFDMPQQTYQGYESGNRKVTLNLLNMFSSFFRVSVDYLAKGTETREPFTLAAHADGELDEEDMEEVMQYVDFIKNKKKKKEQE